MSNTTKPDLPPALVNIEHFVDLSLPLTSQCHLSAESYRALFPILFVSGKPIKTHEFAKKTGLSMPKATSLHRHLRILRAQYEAAGFEFNDDGTVAKRPVPGASAFVEIGRRLANRRMREIGLPLPYWSRELGRWFTDLSTVSSTSTATSKSTPKQSANAATAALLKGIK